MLLEMPAPVATTHPDAISELFLDVRRPFPFRLCFHFRKSARRLSRWAERTLENG